MAREKGQTVTEPGGDGSTGRSWTFLTNHARVLVEIAHNPNIRLRDIAAGIGITERAAQAIVNDLEQADYITRTRVGRRNHYSVDPTRPFRHPADADQRVAGLLTLFAHNDRAGSPPATERPAAPDADEPA
jgi:nucleoside-diphosphate-sugar epimerase